jgi:Rieske Fe-S protein
MAVRFLYPARDRAKTWMFATDLVRMKAGDSLTLRDPTGARIVVARRAESGTADDFVALSSTCPHLGCQVQYQAHKKRFFCPCHNGMFDLEGKATAGPPAAARQSLAHYPLRVEKGLLFIEVPIEGLKSPREG